MSAVDLVVSLFRRGCFAEALARLDASPVPAPERLRADVVRAELLERLGDPAASRRIIERVKQSHGATIADRGVCEFVLGQIAWEADGDVPLALGHVQRAVSLARQADDLHRLCHAQLRLLLMLADSTGPQSVVALMADVRRNCLRLGDSQISAALHVFLGEAEAKRGLVETAARHTALGQRLLVTAPNPWLDGLAENTRVALAIMRSDPVAGLAHGRRALASAEQSGAAALRRAVLANLGNVWHIVGDAPRAIEHWERALAVMPASGERSHAALESLASLYVTQGRLAEADAILARIQQSVRTDQDAQLYGNRHARLALARLRGRQGSTAEAFAIIDTVLTAAERAGDLLLESHALLARAELLGAGGSVREALVVLQGLADRLPDLAPDLRARYECALAACSAAEGTDADTAAHLRRARRIWSGLDNVPALANARRTFGAEQWDLSLAAAAPADEGAAPGGRAVQEVSALLQHAGHPGLLATAVIDLLAGTGSILQASAVARGPEDRCRVLASYQAPEPSPASDAPPRTFALGALHGESIDITCRPAPRVRAAAAVNAVAMILQAVRELERARAEREERLTLWPIEELPDETGAAVIAGRMKEVVALARRVAPTPVGVLITGESGTGKEIVAREVHRWSTRPAKPFVPFNCASVPRELVESQLFGHRRGAFTGADRDQPGLIRAAHGGTLFLDEIADLPLDVQPKLLRFLELGEISPLGEPQTIHVDTRIVAATNGDLERLVREGRFREDLYYRLNIVPLSIPPLRERRDEIPGLVHHFVARAAAEFSKAALRVSHDAMEHLVLYRWPGNVRQLNNEIRRLVALAESGQALTLEMLSPEIRRDPPGMPATPATVTVPAGSTLTAALAGVEKEMIRAALRNHRGRIAQAAKALGISRKGLYLKRQRFGL
jgi:DNA-binding NtrC family response regulator